MDHAPIAQVRVAGQALRGRALAAEAALLFPDQTRALVHSLLRQEFARLEAHRLGLQPVSAEVNRALTQAVDGIRQSFQAGQSADAWARTNFACSWQEYQSALKQRLSNNQLYQMCVRAGSREIGRLSLHMLVGEERTTAETWVRRLRRGASPQSLAAESLDPGPHGDASLPPLPWDLPAPLGDALARASSGEVIGPFRFEGDPLWRVVLVGQRFEASAEPPASAQLLSDLADQPIGPLEAAAWFERTLKRYNAIEGMPSLLAPQPAFVPLRRP